MPGKNICNCPTPPGGLAICEEDQLAICRVIDGQPQMECKDPPMEFRTGPPLTVAERRRYDNWALAEITGHERWLNAPLSPSDELILQQRSYYNPDNGETVAFRNPSFVLRSPPKSSPFNMSPPRSNLPPANLPPATA